MEPAATSVIRRPTVPGLLLVLVLATTPAAPAAATPAGDDAERLAERMLAALGGRDAWASLSNTVNDSQQNRATEPTVVRAVITMDFAQPRFRIETTGPDLHLVRVVDGERSWRLTRDGRLEPLPGDVLADDLRWYASHVYRTLHRIAARDPELALRIGDDGRLEVLARGGRIAWFRLDARGEPYAFGGADDGPGTLSGPWELEHGGIRHPIWVSNADATWRANIERLDTNVTLEATVFAPPEEVPPE